MGEQHNGVFGVGLADLRDDLTRGHTHHPPPPPAATTFPGGGPVSVARRASRGPLEMSSAIAAPLRPASAPAILLRPRRASATAPAAAPIALSRANVGAHASNARSSSMRTSHPSSPRRRAIHSAA